MNEGITYRHLPLGELRTRSKRLKFTLWARREVSYGHYIHIIRPLKRFRVISISCKDLEFINLLVEACVND